MKNKFKIGDHVRPTAEHARKCPAMAACRNRASGTVTDQLGNRVHHLERTYQVLLVTYDTGETHWTLDYDLELLPWSLADFDDDICPSCQSTRVASGEDTVLIDCDLVISEIGSPPSVTGDQVNVVVARCMNCRATAAGVV